MWDDVDPTAADGVVVPYIFQTRSPSPAEPPRAMRALAEAVPEYRRAPEKCLFFDASDYEAPYDFLGRRQLFKTSAGYRFPWIHPLPYVVATVDPKPIESADLVLGFVGCPKTHPLRQSLAVHARIWGRGMAVDVELTDSPFFSLPPERRRAAAERFRSVMRRARFQLCPRGRGLNSRRFFETLAHGRIPVLIADAARLPLESAIDYRRFVVRVPEGMVRWLPEYLREFEARHDLAEASRLALRAHRQHLAPDRLRHLVEVSLRCAGPAA
ncbi:MAG: exostosin family protein [Acidobacteriota bacterium]